MDRLKRVTITSRRSVEIKKQWYAFEMQLEADVDGLDDEAKQEYVKGLWDYAAKEIDNQLEDAVRSA